MSDWESDEDFGTGTNNDHVPPNSFGRGFGRGKMFSDRTDTDWRSRDGSDGESGGRGTRGRGFSGGRGFRGGPRGGRGQGDRRGFGETSERNGDASFDSENKEVIHINRSDVGRVIGKNLK